MKLFKNIYVRVTDFSFVYKETFRQHNIKFAVVGYRFTKITAEMFVVVFGIPYAINASIKGLDALISTFMIKPLNIRKGYIVDFSEYVVDHLMYNDVKYSSLYAIKRKNNFTLQQFIKTIQEEKVTAVLSNSESQIVRFLN